MRFQQMREGQQGVRVSIHVSQLGLVFHEILPDRHATHASLMMIRGILVMSVSGRFASQPNPTEKMVAKVIMIYAHRCTTPSQGCLATMCRHIPKLIVIIRERVATVVADRQRTAATLPSTTLALDENFLIQSYNQNWESLLGPQDYLNKSIFNFFSALEDKDKIFEQFFD